MIGSCLSEKRNLCCSKISRKASLSNTKNYRMLYSKIGKMACTLYSVSKKFSQYTETTKWNGPPLSGKIPTIFNITFV